MGKEDVSGLIRDLEETLRAQVSGIGIAAPQIGDARRVVIVDVSPRDPAKRMKVMINPVILASEEEVPSREGCMSLPDYTAQIMRAARVTVEWFDEKGRRHREKASGIEAVCIQHEVDHLNGILFIDRVVSLKTDVIPRKRKPEL